MSKKDTEAKLAFSKELKRRGHINVKIIKVPADIKSEYNGKIFYWEVKWTGNKDMKYFGAATLTEWEAALNEENFSFVIAYKPNNDWVFHEYTPDEFIKYSHGTICPPQIKFKISVGKCGNLMNYRKDTIPATKDNIIKYINIYNRFKKEILN